MQPGAPHRTLRWPHLKLADGRCGLCESVARRHFLTVHSSDDTLITKQPQGALACTDDRIACRASSRLTRTFESLAIEVVLADQLPQLVSRISRERGRVGLEPGRPCLAGAVDLVGLLPVPSEVG